MPCTSKKKQHSRSHVSLYPFPYCLRLTSCAVQTMMVAFLECHAWYMHTKDGTIYVPRKHLSNAGFSGGETYSYFSHDTQLDLSLNGGLDVVRRLISVI